MWAWVWVCGDLDGRVDEVTFEVSISCGNIPCVPLLRGWNTGERLRYCVNRVSCTEVSFRFRVIA